MLLHYRLHQKKCIGLHKKIKTITGFKTVNIIEQASNLGLANSIIAGVTKVVNQYGRIIVLKNTTDPANATANSTTREESIFNKLKTLSDSFVDLSNNYQSISL